MPKLRILIYGIGSVRNYGCEAIVRGTYQILQESLDSFVLTLGTSAVDAANEQMADLASLRVTNIDYRFSPGRIAMGIPRRLGLGNGSPVRMKYSLAGKYDLLLSAGGDNFCQAPDGTISLLNQDLIRMGECGKAKGKTYVLWGASVGPYSPHNEKVITDHLRQADLLVVRENKSYDYLKSCGCSANLCLAADPAFAMDLDAPPGPVNQEWINIGLNLSELALDHTAKETGTTIQTDEWVNRVANQFAEYLAKNRSYRLTLIPHVMSSDGGSQDDYAFLEKLYAMLREKGVGEQRLHLLPRGLGALKTKKIIARLVVLVAARMHCCVAGISSATPTLFVTYSPKGIGMANYAYQSDNWHLPLQEVGKHSFFSALDLMIARRPELREFLLQRRLVCRDDALEAGRLLAKLIAR